MFLAYLTGHNHAETDHEDNAGDERYRSRNSNAGSASKKSRSPDRAIHNKYPSEVDTNMHRRYSSKEPGRSPSYRDYSEPLSPSQGIEVFFLDLLCTSVAL